MPQAQEFIATGRRKTSVARIRMMPGTGKIDINGRSFDDYFPTGPLQNRFKRQSLSIPTTFRSTRPAVVRAARLARCGWRFRAPFFKWTLICAAR